MTNQAIDAAVRAAAVRPDRGRKRRGCATATRGRASALLTAATGALGLMSWGASFAQYPPAPGTNRESEAYLAATEDFLSGIDLDDPALVFDQLGGTTAANWSVARAGQRIADLKCTERNTRHEGAVVTYRLGKALGLNIFPVAVYRDVDREINGRVVREPCALKEWLGVLTQYYWTRETFSDTDSRSKQALVDALRCDRTKPDGATAFTYYAASAYGDPKLPGVSRVPYYGRSTLLDAARDFSNMMVVDTLIGNEDRFPGGNVFFRSVTAAFTEDDGDVTFMNARLFSLDNEAAFKGSSPAPTHAARDLKDHVSRFDAAMIANLRALSGDPARLREIAAGSAELADFVREGIEIVLAQYAASVSRCGEAMATF